MAQNPKSARREAKASKQWDRKADAMDGSAKKDREFLAQHARHQKAVARADRADRRASR